MTNDPVESTDAEPFEAAPDPTQGVQEFVDASLRLLSWPEQKLELEKYFDTMGNAIGVFATMPEAVAGIETAAALIASAGETMTAIAAQQAETEDALGPRDAFEDARSVGLWAAARVCHDAITQMASMAGQEDEAIAWTASVFSMMLARAGQGLVAQAKLASAAATEAGAVPHI